MSIISNDIREHPRALSEIDLVYDIPICVCDRFVEWYDEIFGCLSVEFGDDGMEAEDFLDEICVSLCR